MAESPPPFLVVGHLNKVHGIRGELFVWSLTDRAEDVFHPGATFRLGDGDAQPMDVPVRSLTIESVRPYRTGWLVRFEEVEDRTQAEFLAGSYLLQPFAEVDAPEEGEYFYHELLGATVATGDGTVVGTVREVYELAPSHMLEVTRPGRPSLLVPLSRPIVTSVERDPLRIVIDPPDGLLDL